MFRAHYIPEGLMVMKTEEFLSLLQGDKSVMEYVAKFNHLSQYATEHVNNPCYNCGKPGHFSKECPYTRQNNPTFQRTPIGQPQPSQFKNGAQKGQNAQRGKPTKKVGQVFHTEVETIPKGEPVMMGTFPVAKHLALMLFDSGASHTFINRTFVMKHGIPIGETKDHFYIQSPRG